MNGGLLAPDPRGAASSGGFGLVDGPIRTPRKRRRPALSCVQCRRRKVKCDRKLPCTQCSQYNNATCKYDDPEVAAQGRYSVPQTLYNTSSISPLNHNHGLPNSRESNLFNIPNTSAPLGFESRSPSSSVPWMSAVPVEDHRSEQHASESLGGVGTPQPDTSVQELKERVRKLEAMIASSSNYTPRPNENNSSMSVSNIPKLRGNIEKTRFFGMSHWMNAYDEFDQLRSLRSDGTFGNGSELQKLVKKCKEIARVVKAERPISSYAPPDFKSHLPARETADPLVQLYFRTFESTYRILHRGLFFKEYEQYWKDPAAGKPSFILKLLLILAIGSVFYNDGTNGNTLRSLAPQWIYAAQTWLSAPFEKGRLNLVGIEVRCLIILARHTHSLENDLLWVSVGSLMRTAMSMGLHRDPSHFPKISVFHAELHRRLWATIIEIATQSSLDCGMPPMFSFHEFDCELPSNYDDEDIDEQTKAYPPKKPDSVFTDTSVQITLLRSLPIRLELSRLINDFRSIPPYEKVLALSSELTSHIRSHASLYHASQSSNHQFTTCHKSLFDLSTRRFLLALHYPFAIQAKNDPRYYFSRKVALDSAMAILSHPPTIDPVEEFTLARLFSGGFFEEIISRASATVALELINQINEDNSPSSTAAARKPLHDAMETLTRMMRSRLEFGVETNVKGYLFLSMVQAQTLAMESGEEVRQAIVKRAKVAAEESYGLLRRQVMHTPLDGQTPAPGREGIGGGAEENNVDWDLLMQDTMMDFDATNNWLFDSWEDAHNMG